MNNRIAFSLLAFTFSVIPNAIFACAVCFGGADSELAKGFTWGVIILGSLPYLLLGGFVSFFYFYFRKQRRSKKA